VGAVGSGCRRNAWKAYFPGEIRLLKHDWWREPVAVKRTIEETWRQVSPYLDEVLDLEPEARQAWVEALVGRAPGIAAEVGVCLAALEELEKQGFLSGTAASILTGRRFGPRTLEEISGHGGMENAMGIAEETDNTRRTIHSTILTDLGEIEPSAHD
jgi:hypothetical protein